MTETRCGYIAIVGRPNVGKSTLLNRLLGQKLSITSRKPQTTRHSLLGIKTDAAVQYIYVDTPGLQDNVKKTVNRYMNRTAEAVLADVDVVLFVVEAARWTAADRYVLERLQHCGAPVITVLNKADKLSAKAEVLPAIEQLHSLIANEFPDIGATEIVPVAALHGTHLDELEVLIAGHLPAGDFFFPDDQITDRSERFLVSEIVREKIMRQLGQELPYEVAVEIEEFKRKQKMLHISAVIHVERDGQKPIIIGRQGQRLKKIGSDARVDIEQLLQEKVMLRLWVKVKAGWSNDERYLKSLGLQGADK